MGQCNSKVHCLNRQDDIKPPSPDLVLYFLVASARSRLNEARKVAAAPRPRRKLHGNGRVRDPKQDLHPTVTPQGSPTGAPHGKLEGQTCRKAKPTAPAPAPAKSQSPKKSFFNKVNIKFIRVAPCLASQQLDSSSSSEPTTSRDATTAAQPTQNSLPGQSETSTTLPGNPHGQSESHVLPQGQRAKVVGRCAFTTQMEAQMGSKDIVERLRAIDHIVETCSANPDMITACIFTVFDNIRDRLVESNRVVNLKMLRALEHIIPQVKESLPKVVNFLVPAIVDSHLNSRNAAIFSAARVAMNALVQNVDSVLLVEILVTKAQQLGGQAKLDLTHIVAGMVKEVYSRKPKMVITEVLPLLWHMLAARSNSAITAILLRALHRQMGPKLQSYSATQPLSITSCMDHLLSTSTI